MSKDNRKLVNCDLCGRDTKNKCRVCCQCSGGNDGPRSAKVLEYDGVREYLYPEEYGRDDEIEEAVSDALDDMVN